jgi:diguanylate cyclase (GGDEF)-like protein
MDIPFSIILKKRHEMLYLGLLSICVASWSLVDIQLFQLFLGNSRLLHVLACYDIILLPIPAILYIDEAFSVRRRFIVYGICILSVLDFIVATGLNLLGIADLRETLFIAHFLIAVCVIIIFIIIIREFISGKKAQKKSIYQSLPAIGIICFAITGVIDLIRFWREAGMDSGLFARMGLLIFVLCYSVSSLNKIVQAIRMGAQAEFISRLAYQDGLTGIGNRTAFQERMTQLQSLEAQKVQQQVGILMFDVNNLKLVNDHLGHSVGDRMILESANCIKDAFSHVQGQYFRIGGDEFVVLLTGDDVKDRCVEGLKYFDELLENYNAQSEMEFYLSVAKGYSIYDSSESEEELFAVYQEADARMYANKRMMKRNQKNGILYETEKLSHAAASLR